MEGSCLPSRHQNYYLCVKLVYVCVHVSVCAYVHVGVYTHMHTCVQRSEVHIGCLPQSLLALSTGITDSHHHAWLLYGC